MTKTVGVHETLEVHELLTFKNLCLTKSTAMTALARDDQLKQLQEWIEKILKIFKDSYHKEE